MNNSYQQEIFSYIESLVSQSTIFTIPKIFVRITGSYEISLFLSQLIYWSDKVGRYDGYMYKTMVEWQEELMMSEYSLNKARRYLKSQGILQEKVKKANGNPTVHYKIDHKALISWLYLNSPKTESCEIT